MSSRDASGGARRGAQGMTGSFAHAMRPEKPAPAITATERSGGAALLRRARAGSAAGNTPSGPTGLSGPPIPFRPASAFAKPQAARQPASMGERPVQATRARSAATGPTLRAPPRLPADRTLLRYVRRNRRQ